MRKLPILIGLKFFKRIAHGVMQNRSYSPVKLASKVIIPACGEDESLNPIIYNHGLAASKELWDDVPQIIADATKRRGYIFDARCHGDSEWTDEFSYEVTVEDLRYFMESINVKKAIIVGHSMGGWTICTFALKYPHMVEMLINEDYTIKDDIMRATDTHVLKYIQLWEESVKTVPKHFTEPEAIVHTFNRLYEKFPTSKGLEEKEFLYKFKYPIKRTSEGYDVKHNMKAICKYLEETINNTRSREIDGCYGGPGLFMMASLSHFHQGMDGEDVKKKFPCVEMIILEGVSHNIHLRFPQKFIDSFLAFYRKYFPN